MGRVSCLSSNQQCQSTEGNEALGKQSTDPQPVTWPHPVVIHQWTLTEEAFFSVLLHCWLGHLTCKIVSEMTYNVSRGT